MKNKELNPLTVVVGVALRGHPRVIGCALFLIVLFVTASAQVNVRLVTDEPEAVLNVLAKRRANQSIDARGRGWSGRSSTRGQLH